MQKQNYLQRSACHAKADIDAKRYDTFTSVKVSVSKHGYLSRFTCTPSLERTAISAVKTQTKGNNTLQTPQFALSLIFIQTPSRCLGCEKLPLSSCSQCSPFYKSNPLSNAGKSCILCCAGAGTLLTAVHIRALPFLMSLSEANERLVVC